MKKNISPIPIVVVGSYGCLEWHIIIHIYIYPNIIAVVDFHVQAKPGAFMEEHIIFTFPKA